MAFILSAYSGAGAQLFDANGDPLVGGKIFTYLAGTTTPATTYTTNSGAATNTNPIILDSAGRTPNDIWVSPGVLYKFVLKTSTDVTIGTYDGIPGIDDPTAFNNLITVTGTNTLVGTSNPAILGYTAGQTFSFVVANTNTGAVTLDVDGQGAKNITVQGATALGASQLIAGSVATVLYDGTQFQLTSSSSNALTTSNLTVDSINAGQLAGLRNKIINGGMDLSQRGTTFTSATGYTLDRWRYGIASTTAIATVTQQADAPSNNLFQNSLRVTVTTADASIAAGDGVVVGQFIEGYNVRDLIGRTFTISFWVRSAKTGTHCVALRNSGNDRSYVIEYSIVAANTWEYKTLTVTSGLITTGTWNWTSGSGLDVSFALAAGTTFHTTAGAWNIGNFLSTANQVNCLDTISNIFAITGVQLEIGSRATPFEYRSVPLELSLSQRYYTRVYGAVFGTGVLSTTTTGQIHIPLPTTMRATPTGIENSAAANFSIASTASFAVSALAFAAASINQVHVQATCATATAGDGARLVAGAADYIGFTGTEL